MSDHLPRELIFEILCKLPVKSIIRFKSMSRSWCSLLEEPLFIDSHGKQTNKSLIIQTNDYRNSMRFLSSDLDSLDNFKEIAYLPDLGRSYSRINFIGSCNGLVALSCTYGETREDVIIWNMSTTEHQILPDPFRGVPYNCTPVSPNGFGYDSVSDSYKIVKIHFYHNYFPPVVYNLKKNQVTWSFFGKYRGHDYGSHVFARGLLFEESLHWVSFSHEAKKFIIVGFGLETEEFYQVPLPDCALSKIAVGVLGTCLAMTNTDSDRDPGGEIWVWVMNKYMVKESWSKIYKVNIFGNVLASLVEGDGILLNGRKRKNLYLYDPVKKESCKVIEIPGGFWDGIVYQEGFTKISAIFGVLGTKRFERNINEDFE